MAKSKKEKSGSRSRSPLVRHKKPILLALGALAIIGGGYQLLNLNQLNNELQIEQAAQLWNITVTGFTVRIDVILKNPTPGEIRVKTPNLTFSFNGELLATSDNVSGTDYQISAYGSVALEPIYVTLKFLTLAANAKRFWAQYQATGQATVTVRALTRINGVFPVEQTTQFDLGKAAVGQKARVVASTSTTPARPVQITSAKVVPTASKLAPLATAIPVARATAAALPPARRVAAGVVRKAAPGKGTKKVVQGATKVRKAR